MKYPIGKIDPQIPEKDSPEQEREEKFLRPRAYPAKLLDSSLRLKAYQELIEMRRLQRLVHINVGWAGGPTQPGVVDLAGCAWTSMGPTNINGRITSIAIDPSNNQRMYVTSVGGIWRSQDGGRRWERVSDDFLATVFASAAVNPGNTNEVFAGAGDPNYHGSATGTGIWKSTSQGAPGSWSKVTPAALDSQVIYRIRIDPTAPNNIYAAASNGVWMGTSGGSVWARLSGFDASTNDIVIDFSVSPRKVYAGVRSGTVSFATGIWKHDGTAWNKRDTGIPAASGRTIALGLAASSPATLYAKIESGSNGRLLGVFKTTTGGETPVGGGNAWSSLAAASALDDSLFSATNGYSWYNSVLEVDPNNANIVWAAGLSIYRSADGGVTWPQVSGGTDGGFPFYVHADQHAIAFDPANSKIVYLGNDGGIDKTTNTNIAVWHWNDISHGMVLTEFYRINSQQATATLASGGSQDNGTEISFGNRTWYQPGGCDGSDVASDASDASTLYANCNGGLYLLANPVPGTPGGGSTVAFSSPSATIAPPVFTDDSVAGAALAAGKLPSGEFSVMKTTNGVNWSTASPSLGAGRVITTMSIAPSSSFQRYYVAVAGGVLPPEIRRTPNGGTSWDIAGTGIPNLWPTAISVDPSDPLRAFAGFGGTGRVIMTTNGGADWTALPGSGATALPSAGVTGIAIDPSNANVLYISTTVGVFKGVITPGTPPTASWSPFDEGLPDGLDVNGIWVNRASKTLLIGTMGHGAYIRDIRPGISCPGPMLLVRDNVLDRGLTPSLSGVADPEHPIPDPARPGFYKPADSPAGRIYWWDSTDIRIDVPSLTPAANQIASADHVEFETCPVEISSCPSGTIVDRSPVRGRTANAYVQVSNRGLQPSLNVRVIALWADATAGLPVLPPDFWTTTFPAGSTSCGTLNTTTGWNAVDPASPCRVIPAINPAMPEVAKFPWSVPSTAHEHSCFLVIAESTDDPIPASVRASNETVVDTLVPTQRHIGLRNLHVVDGPIGGAPVQGLETMSLPNRDRDNGFVDLIISRAGLSKTGRLQIFLPAGASNVQWKGIEPARSGLTSKQVGELRKSGIDSSRAFSVTADDAEFTRIPIAPGQTARIAFSFHSGQGEPNTAARFRIVAQQGSRVIGGGTYVLRINGDGFPPRTPASAKKGGYKKRR